MISPCHVVTSSEKKEYNIESKQERKHFVVILSVILCLSQIYDDKFL